MLPLLFGSYACDPLLGPGSIAGGHPVGKYTAQYITPTVQVPVNFKVYSGRTKYSAFVSKLNTLSEEYLSPQKTQKAAVFFIRKVLGRRLI